jgi:hypothetical protein
MHEFSKFVIDMGFKFSHVIKYQKLVGKLLYLVNTRPNIAYFVRVFNRFMQLHQNSHIEDAKNVISYLEGTIELRIFFGRKNDYTIYIGLLIQIGLETKSDSNQPLHVFQLEKSP